MARKETVTREDILNAAFGMTREEGFSNVTARKLAAKAGCSTQPIFRIYKNMSQLQLDLFDRIILYFEQFYEKYPKEEDIPFINLGMAYVSFAEEEKNLFSTLFLSADRGEKSLYELLNGSKGALRTELKKAQSKGCKDPGSLFMRMWIFIHGAACMVITGDYDLPAEETRSLLKDSYKAYTEKV